MRILAFLVSILLLGLPQGGLAANRPDAGGILNALSGEALAKCLPADNFLEGWAKSGKPRVYTRSDLYELIDGEAELYFQYGFINAASGIYSNRRNPGSLLTADLYQMPDKLMAFGVYSNYKSEDSSYQSLGTEAFGDSEYLYIYQGRFFIRLYCSSSKALKNPIPVAARLLLASLPDDNSPPGELSKLPAQKRVPHSERVLMSGFLGLDDHPMVLEADYGNNGKMFKGFVIQLSDERKTSGLAQRLAGLLAKDSIEKKQLAQGMALYGRTEYNRGLCFIASGSCIRGAFLLDSFQEGIELLSLMF